VLNAKVKMDFKEGMIFRKEERSRFIRASRFVDQKILNVYGARHLVTTTFVQPKFSLKKYPNFLFLFPKCLFLCREQIPKRDLQNIQN
jgi:hypothetical protein